jgi:hypothetical protein
MNPQQSGGLGLLGLWRHGKKKKKLYKLITDDVFNLSCLTHTICDARLWLWYRPMQAVLQVS